MDPELTQCLAERRGSGPQRRALLLPRGTLGLHSMVGACGYGHERDSGYTWNGQERGPAAFGLIQLTLSGQGRLRYQDQTHAVVAGSAMVVHVPHEHVYWCPEGHSWEHLWACLNGVEALRLLRLVEGRCQGVLALDPAGETAIQIIRLVLDGLAGGLDDPFVCSARTYAVLMGLLHEVHGGAELPLAIVRACALAREQIDQPIGVDDMAAAADLSRYHFSRQFRQHLGRSPGDWLLSERLALAARLLSAEGRLSLAEVAERCGFQNANYFGKAFRRAMGVSPGVFKRSGLF